jgi:hypothetical protein
MALTETTYTGNGSVTFGPIPFEYLEDTDVKVTLNGTTTTAFTIDPSTKNITFSSAPNIGVAIRVYRVTDDDDLKATFISGSAIRAIDLNDNFKQNLYVTQETRRDATQAVNTSNTANTTSAAALVAATTAESNSVAAVNTSNTAEANSIAAVSTANTAEANSITAVNTANAANTKSDQAIAAAAVFLVYDPIANVAAIPGSPANNDLIEVLDSTGLESFTPLTGIPAGFEGAAGIPVKLKYTTAGNTWNWVSYYIVDPEARYLNRYSESVVIHVDALNGDDANDGSNVKPKQTIKAAVAAASAGDIIRVAPGVYQEILPIDVTVPNLSIIGESARSVFVHPTVATETNTMFRCNSGTYISGLVFCGLKASGTRGNNPIDDDPTYGLPENQGWVAAFYPGAIIRKSPWIENCTNFADSGIDNSSFNPSNYSGTGGDVNSGMTGGGVLVDGSVPDVTSPLRSFVVNEFTQVCLDGPGMLVCNNGYAQAVSFFGLFCHYHAKALTGGQINMEVGTTNFGRYGLIADGKSDTAIFTATANGAATSGDVTFTINAPTADASWFGDANRPAINMLVKIGSDTYPILSSSANGAGWNVTISRPNPSDRSINLGLINGHADGVTVEFFLRSMISTASHTFEYAGSGTNYTALPENGGEAIEANEALALNNGRVWLTSTDQAGKFKVGDTFQVDQQTGYVTIDPNSVAVNIVSDGTPQLGGDLDVLARKITTSQANNPVIIDGNGTGGVSLRSGAVERLNVGTAQIGTGFLGTAATPAYSFTADTNTGVFSPGADELALATGGSARLTIDSAGAVAIPGSLTVAGESVVAGSIVNADVDAAAAIAGTKISPDFGSQNISTTGTVTVGAITIPNTDGTSGQVLTTDGAGTLSFSTVTGGGGGASVTTSDTAPTSPSDGDLWYDSVGGRLYVYYQDPNTSQWVDVAPQGGGGGGGASVTASATAPTSPTDGALWYDTNSGRLFIYFDDGDTSQWADAAPQSGVSAVELWTQTGGTLTPTTSTDLVAANGFKFPATQVASADPNTLDDYEEGTFTPTAVGETTAGTTTYAAQAGSYTKIGRQVTVNISITYTAATGSGFLRIGGLPFVASNICIAPVEASSFNWAGGTYLVAYLSSGNSFSYVLGEADDVGRTFQTISNEAATFNLTMTYFV